MFSIFFVMPGSSLVFSSMLALPLCLMCTCTALHVTCWKSLASAVYTSSGGGSIKILCLETPQFRKLYQLLRALQDSISVYFNTCTTFEARPQEMLTLGYCDFSNERCMHPAKILQQGQSHETEQMVMCYRHVVALSVRQWLPPWLSVQPHCHTLLLCKKAVNFRGSHL